MPKWWDEEIFTTEWWHKKTKHWGFWPDVQNVSLISEDKHGFWLDLGDVYAQVIPIPTGKHCSRLVRNEKLNKVIKAYLLLPIGGISDPDDRLLIFPKHEIESAPMDGAKLARMHHSLIDSGFSTPNDERGWNERLKIVEDRLKTNTLWRAPHSKGTIGVPRINIENGKRPSPIPLSEKLLCESEHLPALRDAVHLDVLSEWIDTIDYQYSSNAVLRVATGGIAHMRYDVMLMRHAENVAFGLEDKKVSQYLSKVDRYQAKLGIMRLMKMGIPFVLVCLFADLMLYTIGEISRSSAISSGLIFLGLGLLSYIAYRWFEPDWRQA